MEGMRGILNIYKEAEMTSHDVVAILRKTLNIQKIGHTGTLDPMATGVLPLLLGKATRVSDYLIHMDKSYIAEMTFGIRTDTLDSTGTVLSEGGKTTFSEEEILDTFQRFTGKQKQYPPMYSAVKVNGKKLYQYAREGKEIKREPKSVTIHELKLLSKTDSSLRFFCRCSKGTYIRQLIADMAENLGAFAVMTALERTAVGPFTKDNAQSIAHIRTLQHEEIEKLLLPMDIALMMLPKLEIPRSRVFAVVNGQKIPAKGEENVPMRIYSEGEFLGIGKICQNKLVMQKVLTGR